ncbi:MAG: hypothetical protein KKD44_26325, partial [Proteobacteria bacterium]|nr:hypothetical protein [Pseudomonadota bacterium]
GEEKAEGQLNKLIMVWLKRYNIRKEVKAVKQIEVVKEATKTCGDCSFFSHPPPPRSCEDLGIKPTNKICEVFNDKEVKND